MGPLAALSNWLPPDHRATFCMLLDVAAPLAQPATAAPAFDATDVAENVSGKICEKDKTHMGKHVGSIHYMIET